MKTDFSKKILTSLGFVFGLYIFVVVMQPIFFANRFGASTRIAGVDVSYQNKQTATASLEKAFSEYSAGKIVIGGEIVPAKEYIDQPRISETVEEALLAEQKGYFGLSKLMMQRHQVEMSYNDANISTLLLSMYDKVSIVPVDANIDLVGKTTVLPEKDGQRLLLTESRIKIIDGLSNMEGDIDYKVVSQSPVLTADEATAVLQSAQANVTSPITILGDGVSYQIDAPELKTWLKISSTTPKTLVAMENFLTPVSDYYFLDQNKVFSYVDNLAKKIDTTAVNAKLSAVSGKVVVATKEQVGQTVDRKDAVNQIQEAVVGNRVANLVITTVKPEIRSDNLSELGLTELISTGWTDFSGSPVNRTHNVNVGASKFSGVLIKPKEDFSFNKALGPVDASTGYLPELVILADKTVPEYGGGLCQVSSTAFRAALNAGLPILERHAHAYPVVYYKPYGVDATIYLPNPDLRWQNDTGKYILIQTRIEGKKLYFDFYGTKKPGKITFSGSETAVGAVDVVENITPYIYDQGARGRGSFTAVFYRHIYDITGKFTDNDKFTSKYDSPDKYPH